MSGIEHLSIRNFRGIDSLEIDGLTKFNLFVGKNNSGKTTILEALFLLLGMSNPMLPNSINQIRGLNLQSASQFKSLFHNLLLEKRPVIKGKFEDMTERELEIQGIFQQKDASPVLSSSYSSSEITGIELKFWQQQRHCSKTSGQSAIRYNNDASFQIVPDKTYIEKFSGSYISPDKNDLATLIRFSEIIKHNSGDGILKALQLFDNNILAIQPLHDGIYFKIKDINELVPLAIMGDGIKRFLNIITAVWETKTSFICVDEIENGLHYSAHKLLWKSLLSYSLQNEVQLFFTTHNLETLKSLTSVLDDEALCPMQEQTKIFDLTRTKNEGIQIYSYSFEGFKDAIEHENEIRN